MCPCGCGKEDHSDNGSTASSTGSGPLGANSFSLPSPPPSSHQTVTLPNTPDLSPLKSQDSFEGPLDMSKTSPVYGLMTGNSETPPPSPPENDRDKFRCLYLLVDAAVGQLEEIERQKQRTNIRLCAWKKPVRFSVCLCAGARDAGAGQLAAPARARAVKCKQM